MYRNVWRELAAEKAMIFLAGPRQSGKTTLAQMIAAEFANRLYFNWDDPKDRTQLLGNPFFFQEIERRNGSVPFVVFDEIHKFLKASAKRAGERGQSLKDPCQVSKYSILTVWR